MHIHKLNIDDFQNSGDLDREGKRELVYLTTVGVAKIYVASMVDE